MLVLGSSGNQIKHQDKPLALQNLSQADMLLLVLWLPGVLMGLLSHPEVTVDYKVCRYFLSDGNIQSSSGDECQLPQDLLVNFLFSLPKTSLFCLSRAWLISSSSCKLKNSSAWSGCLMLETMVLQKCMLPPACCPHQTIRHNLLNSLPSDCESCEHEASSQASLARGVSAGCSQMTLVFPCFRNETA